MLTNSTYGATFSDMVAKNRNPARMGRPPKADPITAKVNIVLPKSLLKVVDTIAKVEGTSRSAVIRYYMYRGFEREAQLPVDGRRIEVEPSGEPETKSRFKLTREKGGVFRFAESE